MKKIGRNDSCPCGSGRKYKQCCQPQADAQATKVPVVDTSIPGLLRTAIEHHQAGRLLQAEAIYRQMLQIAPNNPDALHLLGLIFHQAGKFETAVDLISRAISVKPSGPMYYNLGVSLQAQGNLDAAVSNYRRALAIKPRDAKALANLGAALKIQGQLDAAAESFRRALAINPGDAGVHNNLGVVLQGQGDFDAAIKSYRKAISLNPDDAEAHNNLGNALRDKEELDAAITCLRQAIALKPDYAEAHNNLGNALQDQGKLDAAIASFHTALTIKPDYVEAHWNESLALLAQGRLIEGWVKHDWRLQQKENIPDYRNLPSLRPMFSGENLAGKTILVWAEQGLGDELFYAGVLSDVIRAAGHCVIECDPRLVPLYARSFPTAEIIPKCYPPHPRTQQPDIELQCPVGNLPRWFRPSIESFPRHHGYLVPDPQRVAFWKQRLDALGPAPKVGITWRSKHRNQWRNLHYTELSQWGPILTVPGLIFINLQYDDCRAELEAARKQFGVEIHAWDDIDQMNDLDELTALMAALDLVIAPTTTPAIMAGALGAPAWMLLTRHITWKTLGTESIPMFPDMRLIWRPRNVKWDVVLEAVAVELRRGSWRGEAGKAGHTERER
jgi:tetratricopeptide (TPR) repeat protein